LAFVGNRSRLSKRRKVITIGAIALIAFLFSPLPGVEAIQIVITDPGFGTNNPLDFKIIVLDDSVAFPIKELEVNEAGLAAPHGVEQLPDGHLFVAEHDNNRILHFSDPDTSFSNADFVIGQPDFFASIGDDTANQGTGVAANTLWNPGDIVFEEKVSQPDELWVADSSNNRVLRYSAPFSTDMNADLVLGQPDFLSNDANQGLANPTASTLNVPIGIEINDNGQLIVADSANNRVLIYEPPFTNGEAATVVLGQTRRRVSTRRPYLPQYLQ